jgi:hypothetical protein
VVGEALKRARLAARRLELDITEAVFARDPVGAVDRLHALRKLGCRVALDDFGAGQSSLAHLRRFPFDTLKIDRAFTRELLISRDARAMVRNILAMARSLRMATVAEGVEEPAQIKLLDGEGCGAVQGYYLAKPMPAGEIERFLIGWREDRKPVSRSRGRGATEPAPGDLGGRIGSICICICICICIYDQGYRSGRQTRRAHVKPVARRTLRRTLRRTASRACDEVGKPAPMIRRREHGHRSPPHPRPLPGPDPLGPPGRLAAAALAHAFGALDRCGRLARLAPGGGLQPGHHPHAKCRLLRQ